MKLYSLKNKITRFLYNIRIKNKLLVSFSILAIFPAIVVGLMSYYYSQKYLIEAETNSLIQSMHQLRRSLDFFFEIYMDRTTMIFNSTELQDLIKSDVTNIEEAVNANTKLNKLMGYIENDYRYPEMKNSYYFGGSISSRLYLTNSTITSYEMARPMDSIINEEWVRRLFDEERAFSWDYGQVINNNMCISLNRRLVNFDNAEVAGLLQLFIPVSRVSNIIENSVRNKNISIFYFDENFNKIASVGDKRHMRDVYFDNIKKMDLSEGVSQRLIEHEKFIVGYMTSNSTKWNIVYMIPVELVTGKTGVITLVTLITIIAALIICFIIAYSVSTVMTKRIDLLLQKTNAIDGNNFTPGPVIKGNDELSQLGRNFDKMLVRLKDLIENVYMAQIEASKTRLELLQEQINPHLLYNTLSMVAATAGREGQSEICNVAENLSAFYRGTLNRGKIVYSMAEEISMVKHYINIVKYVYDLDIDTIFEIDDEVFDFYTIKLIIQPIVENSILHGIRPKKAGVLMITGSIENDDIVLVVSDDGIGMDSDLINSLNQITSKSEFENSFGIVNVIKRIKLLLGDGYGLVFSSTMGEGTTVAVTLPKLAEDDIEF